MTFAVGGMLNTRSVLNIVHLCMLAIQFKRNRKCFLKSLILLWNRLWSTRAGTNDFGFNSIYIVLKKSYFRKLILFLNWPK